MIVQAIADADGWIGPVLVPAFEPIPRPLALTSMRRSVQSLVAEREQRKSAVRDLILGLRGLVFAGAVAASPTTAVPLPRLQMPSVHL